MTDARAVAAREALERAGIDVNGVLNGFWGKKRHAGTHTKEYLERMAELLNEDTPTDAVASNLELLWKEIEVGTWMKWMDKHKAWR